MEQTKEENQTMRRAWNEDVALSLRASCACLIFSFQSIGFLKTKFIWRVCFLLQSNWCQFRGRKITASKALSLLSWSNWWLVWICKNLRRSISSREVVTRTFSRRAKTSATTEQIISSHLKMTIENSFPTLYPPFSSRKDAVLSVNTKNNDYWPVPKYAQPQ